MNKFFSRLSIFFIVALVFITFCKKQAEKPQDIPKTDEIVAGNPDDLHFFTEEYPPFNFTKDGKLTGISIDLLTEAFRIAKLKYTINDIKSLPWARGYNALENVKNTVLFSTVRSKERENKFKWACPVALTTQSLIAKKSKKIVIKSIQDIKKYKIGVIRDDIGEQLCLSKGIPDKNLDRVANADQNVKKLDTGRIDLWAYDPIVAMWFIKKGGLPTENFEVVYVLDKGVLCYAFNKETDDAKIKQIQDAINELMKKQPGQQMSKYEQILASYK